jgi:cytochrome d ubiquinol oxidase subunit I
MGRVVAAYQPTKFALMENAMATKQNPLVALLAYGDPGRPIVGFDSLSQACSSTKGTKIGDLVSAVVPDLVAGDAGSIDVGELCLADTAAAQQRAGIVNVLYYSKIATGIIAFASIIAITSLMFNVRGISRLARMVLGRLGERKVALVLSLIVLLSSIGASVLGWYVREAGRKPWTVYGLIYPAEIVTPVPFSPLVVLLFTALFLMIGAGGLYGIYVVATRPIKFVELLRKGAGLEKE